jgi:hypothetical protein
LEGIDRSDSLREVCAEDKPDASRSTRTNMFSLFIEGQVWESNIGILKESDENLLILHEL